MSVANERSVSMSGLCQRQRTLHKPQLKEVFISVWKVISVLLHATDRFDYLCMSARPWRAEVLNKPYGLKNTHPKPKSVLYLWAVRKTLRAVQVFRLNESNLWWGFLKPIQKRDYRRQSQFGALLKGYEALLCLAERRFCEVFLLMFSSRGCAHARVTILDIII